MSGRGQSWPIGPSIDRLAEFLDRVVNDTVVVQIPVATVHKIPVRRVCSLLLAFAQADYLFVTVIANISVYTTKFHLSGAQFREDTAT